MATFLLLWRLKRGQQHRPKRPLLPAQQPNAQKKRNTTLLRVICNCLWHNRHGAVAAIQQDVLPSLAISAGRATILGCKFYEISPLITTTWVRTLMQQLISKRLWLVAVINHKHTRIAARQQLMFVGEFLVLIQLHPPFFLLISSHSFHDYLVL